MIKRLICRLLGHDFDYDEYAKYLDSGKPKRNPLTFYCVRCKQLKKL